MLERINGPQDIMALNQEELADLAQEIREFLIEKSVPQEGTWLLI